jgi:hypothetical protein
MKRPDFSHITAIAFHLRPPWGIFSGTQPPSMPQERAFFIDHGRPAYKQPAPGKFDKTSGCPYTYEP